MEEPLDQTTIVAVLLHESCILRMKVAKLLNLLGDITFEMLNVLYEAC